MPNKHIYVLLSDGELDEGSNWEAFLFSTHHGLGNLTAIIDYNKLQSLDSIENTLGLEPFEDKLLAFGWSVIQVNGHDIEQLLKALKHSRKSDKPTVIIAHATKGYPISFMKNEVKWHYSPPSQKQLVDIKVELDAFYL